jgi:hypothetical protein
MTDLIALNDNAIRELRKLYGVQLDNLLNVRILDRLKHISYLGVTLYYIKKQTLIDFLIQLMLLH